MLTRLVLAGSFALASCATFQRADPNLVRLFDGETLTGWHADIMEADDNPNIAPTFIVRDGNLVSLGSPQGHLITDEVFSNYRLTVEYRWSGDPGNCGVLVHSSTPRRLYDQFPQSIEVQMYHENAGDFWCIGEDVTVDDMPLRRGDREAWGVEEGKLRRVKNTTDGSENPLGEWNTMVVECIGAEIHVWVNDDKVNHGYDCTASEGQIALQAEGAEVEFRRVDLVRL